MRKIYAIEAFKFGWKTFFKNPLFLIFAFVLAKLMWVGGFLVSALVSAPFFLPFFKAISKIIGLVKQVIGIVMTKLLPLKSMISAEGVKENVKDVAEGVGQAMAGGAPESGGGGIGGFFGSVFGGVGKAVKGVVPLAKIGTKLAGAKKAFSGVLEGGKDIKEVALHVLKNPWILFLVVVGLIVLVVLVKLTYDYVMLGWTKLSLDFSKKGKSDFSRLFSKPRLFFRYFLATVFFAVIVFLPSNLMYIISPLPKGFVIGLILSVIVCTYLSLSFWFYPYYLIDKKSCITEAFSLSYKLEGGFINLFLLYLIVLAIVLPIAVISLLLIHVLGFIISWFIFGICVAIMWIIAFLATANLYVRLNPSE